MGILHKFLVKFSPKIAGNFWLTYQYPTVTLKSSDQSSTPICILSVDVLGGKNRARLSEFYGKIGAKVARHFRFKFVKLLSNNFTYEIFRWMFGHPIPKPYQPVSDIDKSYRLDHHRCL